MRLSDKLYITFMLGIFSLTMGLMGYSAYKMYELSLYLNQQNLPEENHEI